MRVHRKVLREGTEEFEVMAFVHRLKIGVLSFSKKRYSIFEAKN